MGRRSRQSRKRTGDKEEQDEEEDHTTKKRRRTMRKRTMRRRTSRRRRMSGRRTRWRRKRRWRTGRTRKSKRRRKEKVGDSEEEQEERPDKVQIGVKPDMQTDGQEDRQYKRAPTILGLRTRRNCRRLPISTIEQNPKLINKARPSFFHAHPFRTGQAMAFSHVCIVQHCSNCHCHGNWPQQSEQENMEKKYRIMKVTTLLWKKKPKNDTQSVSVVGSSRRKNLQGW